MDDLDPRIVLIEKIWAHPEGREILLSAMRHTFPEFMRHSDINRDVLEAMWSLPAKE